MLSQFFRERHDRCRPGNGYRLFSRPVVVSAGNKEPYDERQENEPPQAHILFLWLLYMPYYLAFHKENDQLGDIDRMVGHAFEVLRYEEHPGRPRYRLHILHHVRQKLAKDLVEQLVDHVVVLHDLSRHRDIFP